MEPYQGDLRDSEREYEPIHPGGFDWRGLLRKIWAPVAVLVGLAVKFGAAAAKFGSIFVAVGGYALLWGWTFGIGFVLLILVHEMGHFLEARREGFKPSWPVFIPFLGAYVALKDARMSPWQSARISLAGPIVGGAGAAAFWIAGNANDSDLLRALGYTGFFLNLINLVPIGFLDGGHILRAFRYLRLGGARDRAYAVGGLYALTVLLLVIGMFAAHVGQDRL
jgi:Zn-dependent protease